MDLSLFDAISSVVPSTIGVALALGSCAVAALLAVMAGFIIVMRIERNSPDRVAILKQFVAVVRAVLHRPKTKGDPPSSAPTGPP